MYAAHVDYEIQLAKEYRATQIDAANTYRLARSAGRRQAVAKIRRPVTAFFAATRSAVAGQH